LCIPERKYGSLFIGEISDIYGRIIRTTLFTSYKNKDYDYKEK